MNDRVYYECVYRKLKNVFEDCNWVLGYGEELIRYGWDPGSLLVTAEPIEQLRLMTVRLNLEIFIPIFGFAGQSVLFSKDAEIFMSDPHYLYHNVGSQLHFFRKHIYPVILFETELLERHGVPHMIDLTPSGWHILFRVKAGTRAFQEIADIGYLEQELKQAYLYCDPHDIKRNPALGLKPGLVFSGIGRLKEYLSLKSMTYARQQAEIPITISDSEEKCVNEDITDTGDPGYMRIMRSPFSLHKKRRRYITGSGSLQDVIMRVYSRRENSGQDLFIRDLDYLLECMWSKEMAVEHSTYFSGFIPYADDESVSSLVNEYKESDLYAFHRRFDTEPELPPGEALNRAMGDFKLSDKSRNFIAYPCPRALQPRALKKFVRDLLEHGWHPKHVGGLINDFYHQPLEWNTDWIKYVRKTRAFFWARIYGAVYYFEEGELKL